MSVCDRTGKVVYGTEAKAMKAVVRMWEARRGSALPFRAYECEFCGFYHTTSKAKRGRST